MANDKKRYNYMEQTLADINSKFICLDTDDVKRNNKILQSVLNTIINKMKEKDPLFKALFTRVFYGGSYYDGLRVGNPEEFDLDLLLSLPTFAEPTLTTSNIPGFVHLQLKKFDAWMKQPEAMPAYRTFSNLFDDQRYLDTQKVLAWMEGIVQKSLNDFPTSGSKKMLTNENGRFEVIVQKGGPALTLKISGPSGLKMDVDLVTCFVFHADKWPTNGFKKNPVRSKPDFFIVPKKPKASGNEPIPRYWRLSFQEQERVLIDGKRTLKPTIKLLKKLRDNLQHNCIASYYIKTVLLHIADKRGDEFWQNSLSYVFMTVLKEYREEYIEKGKIPYYWNKNNNLIGGVGKQHLENINNRLKAIINKIENNNNNPNIIAEFLLDRTEYATFLASRLNINS